MIMKRFVVVLISVLIFLLTCGFDSQKQKVYDEADILLETEEESLNQLCLEAATKTQSDFVIVTVNSLEGKSATAYADDFFDYGGFGYEKKKGTGTIFLISMEERDIAFSTSGDSVELFSSSTSDKIIETVGSYLSDGEYYNGLVTYINLTKEYIENDGKSNSQRVLDFIIQIVASVVVASIVIWIMYSGSKSKMSVNGYTYASGHKSNILRQHDVFKRTTTIRRHIDTTPKGGGSGSHVGSSGNRHGGSSGKF
jgi:uncharacterized protein